MHSCLVSSPPLVFPFPFTVLVFEFDPNEYMIREDDGAVDLSVVLAKGDLGEFTIVLTAVTDDNNTIATATGKYVMKFYRTSQTLHTRQF